MMMETEPSYDRKTIKSHYTLKARSKSLGSFFKTLAFVLTFSSLLTFATSNICVFNYAGQNLQVGVQAYPSTV